MQIISLILETNKVISHTESNISITPEQVKFFSKRRNCPNMENQTYV